MTGTAELGRGAVDLDLERAENAKAHHGHPSRRYHGLDRLQRLICRGFDLACSRFAAGISLVAARARDGFLVGRTQRPEPKELDVYRIPLILGVFVALSCAGIGTAADGSAGRPDGRLLPDGADIQRSTPASRPDDRGDRFTPGASSEPAVGTGRPDGRTVPDAVDARNAVTPVVSPGGRKRHDLVRLARGADRGPRGRRSGTRNGRSPRSPPPRACPRSLTCPPSRLALRAVPPGGPRPVRRTSRRSTRLSTGRLCHEPLAAGSSDPAADAIRLPEPRLRRVLDIDIISSRG